MNLRTTTRKVVLPLLLAGAVALVATSAGAADDDKQKPSNGTRGHSVLWDEIQNGKAKKVQRPGPEKHTTAVWNGCKFHYLKTKVTRYEGTNGAVGEVSTDPDPLPPKEKACVGTERNPTAEEMAESQARVAAANAGEQGLDPSLPGPPPHPDVRPTGS